MGEFEAEADTINETGLLVEATKAAGGVDDLVLFLEGFAGHGLIEVIKGLLDLVGVCIAVQLVVGAAEHSQNCVGVLAEVCLLGGLLCLQGG